jgi:hypothetical protein
VTVIEHFVTLIDVPPLHSLDERDQERASPHQQTCVGSDSGFAVLS